MVQSVDNQLVILGFPANEVGSLVIIKAGSDLETAPLFSL